MSTSQRQQNPQRLNKTVTPKRIYQIEQERTIESLQEELNTMKSAIISLVDSTNISESLSQEFITYAQAIKGDDIDG